MAPASDIEKASSGHGLHEVDRATTHTDDMNDIAHAGVKRVEATHKVFKKYSKWALFIRSVEHSFFVCMYGHVFLTLQCLQSGSFGIRLLARWHNDLVLPHVRDVGARQAQLPRYHRRGADDDWCVYALTDVL